MNILFISKYATMPETGKATRQYFFSKELANRGHKVTLVSSRSTFSKNIPNFKGKFLEKKTDNLTTVILQGPIIELGFNIRRIWSWLLFEYQLLRNYRKFKDSAPDVILVSSLSIFTFLTGVLFKKLFKKPLILEVRDIYPLTLIEIGGMHKFNPIILLLGWIEKFGYRNADYLITTLENTQQHFDKITTKPVGCLWLPMGYETGMYDDNLDNESTKICNTLINLKKDKKFIVGYAGTLGTANALNNLLRLTKDKMISKNNIHFVFLGSGPNKEEYIQKYSSQNVSFFDSINRKYLPFVLNKCDVLLNTWLCRPIYHYGISPNKWIDYMFASRPVILALSAESKIFREGNFGWQIPAEDYERLKEIVLEVAGKDHRTLEEKGINGKNYLLKNLSYQKLTNKLESILHHVKPE